MGERPKMCDLEARGDEVEMDEDEAMDEVREGVRV